MTNTIISEIKSQFGASIEMLENAILLCPDEFWNTEERFWYNAFHCIFFMDYYLSTNPKEFVPPIPFDFSEFEDQMPSRVYTKPEILAYLKFCKNKSTNLFAEMDFGKLNERWINESGSMNYSLFEILIYNMRHIQHHAAQLNLLLRQSIQNAPDWVFRSYF